MPIRKYLYIKYLKKMLDKKTDLIKNNSDAVLVKASIVCFDYFAKRTGVNYQKMISQN